MEKNSIVKPAVISSLSYKVYLSNDPRYDDNELMDCLENCGLNPFNMDSNYGKFWQILIFAFMGIGMLAMIPIDIYINNNFFPSSTSDYVMLRRFFLLIMITLFGGFGLMWAGALIGYLTGFIFYCPCCRSNRRSQIKYAILAANDEISKMI